MIINVCIFEDNDYNSLYPLTFNRPAYDLLLGIDRLFDKINRYYHLGNITLHCRDYLKPLVKQRYPDYTINQINIGTPCLFINGRVIMTTDFFSILDNIDEKQNILFTYQGQVAALFLRGELLNFMRVSLNTTPSSEDLITHIRPKSVAKELNQLSILKHPWELPSLLQHTLQQDFAYYQKPGIIKGQLKSFTSIYQEDQVFVDHHSFIEDFVVIDARKGPVYISDHVTIKAHSRLEGPLYVGPHCQLLGGSFSHSSFGPYCKLSGEISHSLIQGYTNKAHEGFLGHSVLGEWINLGAFTSTSNLKNTYSPVTVQPDFVDTPTQAQFLGSMMGDYVKTSINTSLNAGTMIGFGSQLSGHGFHDKFIPPFSWGQPGQYDLYRFPQFIATTQKMMARRSQALSSAAQDTYKLLHQLYGVKPRQSARAAS